MDYIIGIDEVGRGPIAGPLVLCACAVQNYFDVTTLFPKGILKDSKKLSEKNRVEIVSKLEPLIENKTVVYGFGEISSNEIDSNGLSLSIKKAVQNALDKVHLQSISVDTQIYLDGSLYADVKYPNQETIIKGDEKVGAIALASIIAKVYRDEKMKNLAAEYPLYGFENHVGYGTKFHYEAIKKFGITEHHRKSFLKKVIE